MSAIDLTRAFYIKLGRGGAWEVDSIESHKLRLGWSQQLVDDINDGRWEIIELQLRAEHHDKRIAEKLLES